MTRPAFPHIRIFITLYGQDGHILSVIARVQRAMKEAKVEDEIIRRFTANVKARNDYFAQLQEVARWVDFNNGEYLT